MPIEESHSSSSPSSYHCTLYTYTTCPFRRRDGACLPRRAIGAIQSSHLCAPVTTTLDGRDNAKCDSYIIRKEWYSKKKDTNLCEGNELSSCSSVQDILFLNAQRFHLQQRAKSRIEETFLPCRWRREDRTVNDELQLRSILVLQGRNRMVVPRKPKFTWSDPVSR